MKILVPIATRRSAEIVGEYIERVATSLSAEIVALHVHETAEPNPVGLGGLEVIRAVAEAAGLPVRTLAQQGPLVRGICMVAEAEQVDLVVMGCHPFMPVGEWTASKVLHDSDLPVVVIPHGLPR